MRRHEGPPERDWTAGDWVFRVKLYDHAAPRIFAEARDWLDGLIPYAAGIEHIGSTAVPGLAGRGSVDILVLVPREFRAEALSALYRAGLCRGGDPPLHDCRSVSGRFIRPSGEDYPVHVHLTWPESPAHRDLLDLRDHLRADPEGATGFGRLKYEWSRVAGPDDEAYERSKAGYLAGIRQRLERRRD